MNMLKFLGRKSALVMVLMMAMFALAAPQVMASRGGDDDRFEVRREFRIERDFDDDFDDDERFRVRREFRVDRDIDDGRFLFVNHRFHDFDRFDKFHRFDNRFHDFNRFDKFHRFDKFDHGFHRGFSFH